MKRKLLKYKKIIFIIFCSILIELFLSNIGILNLLFLDKNILGNIEIKKISETESEIEIETKNIQIQNVKIYCNNDYYKTSGIIKIIPEVKIQRLEKVERQSKFSILNRNVRININCESKCDFLKLRVTPSIDSDYIDKIVLNDTSVQFMTSRFLVIILIVLSICTLKKANKDKLFDFEKDKKAFRIISLVILALMIGITFQIVDNEKFKCYKTINSYSFNFLNAQIEAFFNGQTNLFKIPNDEVTDYSIYNGKYYSYFGLSPLLLLMPFKFITGYYLSYMYANIFFFIIMFLLINKLYNKLIKNYVKEVSKFNYILGFITLIFSTTMMILLGGISYDTVIICAIDYTLLSYILILSIYEEPKNRLYLKIISCSISMGLMILSKPSFIAYYIFLFYLLISLKKILDKKVLKNCIIIFSIPISLIAIFQMWWNYIRFDSIICFGAKYQIAIWDTKILTYFSISKVLKGILEYLFKLPVVNFSVFPFITLKNWDINLNFNSLMYNWGVLGIFIVPVSWIWFFYKSIKKHSKLSNELCNTIKFLFISIFVVLLINIRNGVSQNYSIDIRIFMYMFSIILCFKIMEKYKNGLVSKVFIAICISSILLTLPINFMLEMDTNTFSINTYFLVYLKNIFEFWV